MQPADLARDQNDLFERQRIVRRALGPATLDADVTGVQWLDGTLECRARLEHPAGSLVARPGDIGVLVTDPQADCDVCSDACAIA